MKITSLIAITLTVALAGTATADSRSFGGGSSSNYSANGKFGLGLEVGQYFGLNGKYFLTPSGAIDFGVGGSGYAYQYYGGEGVNLYADYLWHPTQLTENSTFKLPFYVGLGGRFWDFNYACGRPNNCTGASAIGVRVPLGLAFDFNHVPLDLFVQIVPTLDFYRNYSTHSTYLDVDFTFGIRYWF